MRRIVAVVGATIALAIGASPVAAAAPEKVNLEPVQFVIEGSCDFAVNYEELQVSGHQLVFFDANGEISKIIINGHWLVRLTNVETGESVRLNISGQFYITDTFTARGRNLLFAPVPEPMMVLTVGNVALDLSAGLAIEQSHGRVVDVCARLAA